MSSHSYPSPNPSIHEKSLSSQSHLKQKSKTNQLQQLILNNQNFSEEFKGYYTIVEWRKLNQMLFNPTEYQQKTTIINCWRLMKLINFGDDIIPTGLVFDCIMTLMNVDQTLEQTQALLKSIFLKFIELNGKYLTEKERDELAFFKVVRTVVEGYRKIIAEKLDVDNDENSISSDSKIHDRNQQLYLLHGVMNYKKDLQKLKRIQSQFKECTFEPKINEHSAQIGQSRYHLPSQRKTNLPSSDQKSQNYGIIDQSQQFSQSSRIQSQLFKARPSPNYPSIEPPRQYFDHLDRMKKSRQIRNINSVSRRGSQLSEVKEFSIQQREEERRKNKLQNVRILFMIKVEVGKRIYRVKVRENMGVNETVSAIQKMVGFKDNQIIDVVKGYFINWDRRQKSKLQSPREHALSSDGY